MIAVSIRQADPHAFERSVGVQFNPPVATVSIRQADPHAFEQVLRSMKNGVGEAFQSAKRILTPSNHRPIWTEDRPVVGFNPPSGSSRLRTKTVLGIGPGLPVVSIRQADPHAFEPGVPVHLVDPRKFQSAKRILTPSNLRPVDAYAPCCEFQSAKRILTPSNLKPSGFLAYKGGVSIRQADPHAFEQNAANRGHGE